MACKNIESFTTVVFITLIHAVDFSVAQKRLSNALIAVLAPHFIHMSAIVRFWCNGCKTSSYYELKHTI